MPYFPGNVHPQLTFKPTGKWDEATRLLGRLDPSIKIAAVKAQTTVANTIIKKVKGHLLKQDLPWPALSDRWSREKAAHGADGRMLIATQSYLNNITTWHRKNGWEVFMGVKKGIYGRTIDGKRSQRDISTIATIQEYGRDRSQRRPLWNPTIQELGNTKGIKKLYLDRFATELRKLPGMRQYIARLKQF